MGSLKGIELLGTDSSPLSVQQGNFRKEGVRGAISICWFVDESFCRLLDFNTVFMTGPARPHGIAMK